MSGRPSDPDAARCWDIAVDAAQPVSAARRDATPPPKFRPRGALSRDMTARPESWVLVERWVPRYPYDWALVFRRGDEVLEVLVPEEVWRAFDA